MKRMKTETDSTTLEKRTKRPNKSLRRFGATVAAAAVLAGGIGTVAGARHESHPNPLNRVDRIDLPDYIGTSYVDESITELDIAEGANVRSVPALTNKATGDNLLVKLNDALAVKTDRGVPRCHTVDGDWFGFSKEELVKALGNVDPDLKREIKSKIEKDTDGELWVNERRATPIRHGETD